MKAHLSMFVLSAILIAGIGTIPAFGQNSIVLTTDKESYSDGDIVLITGEISQLLGGYAVTISVINPNNDGYANFGQPEVGADGKFSHTMTVGGAMYAGTYTVIAQYGDNKNNTGEVTFEYDGEGGGGSPTVEPPRRGGGIVTATTVSVEGSDDLIGYTITGGKLLGVTPDVNANSLIVYIDATEDGSITLTIPRTILEAVDPVTGEDIEFFVLVDLEEGDFTETVTETHRTLTIEFLEGSQEIEIVGTWVVPEFGTIAAMILAVAIITIIAVSAKSRLSIIPRY